MTKKEPKKIFYKALIACIAIVGFGVYISIRGSKEKTEFQNITGKIAYFDKTFQEITYGNKGNHRFIQLANFPLVYDVFIGKGSGDFSPKFEQLDMLKLGDEITVYHAVKRSFQRNRDLRFNKTVQFIDKNGAAYFIRGTKDKSGGYIFGGIGFLLGFSLLILKKAKKIN